MNPVPSISFRAFRAIEEPELCQSFLTGHRRVLETVGVKQLTSAKEEWTQDPTCYVIIAQNPETGKVIGGTRVQIATPEFPLPIEGAIGELDASIFNFVKGMPAFSCAELCGMWNSREVSGIGVGSTYLNRIGIALLSQIGVTTLLGLAASWTLEMGKRAGFEIAPQFGNGGTFYYPKQDYVATAIIIRDVINLPFAHPEEKVLIQEIRDNPIQVRQDDTRLGKVDVSYDLKLNSVHSIVAEKLAKLER